MACNPAPLWLVLLIILGTGGLLAGTFIIFAPSDAQTELGTRQPNLVPKIGRPIVETRRFDADDCAVVEQCVSAPGTRKLLRFDLDIANIGEGNLFLGEPWKNPSWFEWSPCHRHYHFIGFSHYTLLDAHNVTVGFGHKQSFCLRDTRANTPVPGGDHHGHFKCDRQGISSGYSDIYKRQLDCQWIDVTDVPSGHYYTIVATINPLFNETRFDDNEARHVVYI